MEHKWLVVGLGNPGQKYELTRHNFGFLVIDALCAQHQITTMKSAFSGLFARADVDQNQTFLLKPETFMNRSGTSVQQALSFHKISLSQLIVIHDELDLPLGSLRIKIGGGHGGNNGIKDISRLLGPDFIRIRLGIGRPEHKGTEADYVLTPFSKNELTTVQKIIVSATNTVATIIKNGFEQAQRDCQIKSLL